MSAMLAEEEVALARAELLVIEARGRRSDKLAKVALLKSQGKDTSEAEQTESIQETPMVRFYSSIYAANKMLIRQMSCDSAFHGIPHQIAAAQ